MTLNITVLTRRYIYQSADYRLRDNRTRETTDFATQKIAFVNTFSWNASVCFAGVGYTATVDVGEWLTEIARAVPMKAPLDHLVEQLRRADEWLADVDAPLRRHSFNIGAFVGSTPTFVLISNFERPDSSASPVASERLSVFQVQVRKAKVFLSGDRDAVTSRDVRRLTQLALSSRSTSEVETALAHVNRAAAERSTEKVISPACFTTHLQRTGTAGGTAHGTGDRPLPPTLPFPEEAKQIVQDLLDQQYGPGKARFVQFVVARSEPTPEYHQTQLRDKPNDASVHSNYGAYLHDVEKDLERADLAYQRAIELDPRHGNALGNRANLLWQKGQVAEAAQHYVRALEAEPRNETIRSNYAFFVIIEAKDYPLAVRILDEGIVVAPENGRLHYLRGCCASLMGSFDEALGHFERARHYGAEQVGLSASYATALHASGAKIGESIAAYRVALALNPSDPTLKLNLAQLLFIRNDQDAEARRHLREALELGLDESAQLEAQFYLLAHIADDPTATLRTIQSLLAGGGKLTWDVQPNIDVVGSRDERKAELLKRAASVMRGDTEPQMLRQILAEWLKP